MTPFQPVSSVKITTGPDVARRKLQEAIAAPFHQYAALRAQLKAHDMKHPHDDSPDLGVLFIALILAAIATVAWIAAS